MHDEQILDLEFALKKLEGNRKLLTALINLYLTTQTKTEDNLAKALETSDRDQIRYYAHYIRSSLSNIGARSAAGTAFILEKQSQTDDIDSIRKTTAALTSHLQQIRVKLAEMGYDGRADQSS